MNPTLRSMLAMDVLTDGQPEIAVAGSSLDRPVRWVHVTELDDVADLLGGHEVVLTTGLPVNGPTADPRRFVEQLVGAEACGLVVELGPKTPALPAELVASAEQLGLPLIALHRPVRFVSITEAVHRLIVGEQFRGLAFAQRTHEVFTALSLDSADATMIVNEAAELIDGPVVLEDVGRRVVAVAERSWTPKTLLRDWEERSRSAPVLDVAGQTGPEGWLSCPVGLRGSTWGRLLAVAEVDDPVQTAVVLQRAAQALQLSRLVERDAIGLQFQAHESLLQELMEGRISREGDAVSRARALGMTAASRYVPVVAHFGRTAVVDQIVRQRRARGQLETVSEAIDSAGLDAIAGGMSDGEVGLVLGLATGADEVGALTALSEALSRHIGGSYPFALGAGPVTSRLLEAATQLRATVHIASAALAMPRSSLPFFRATDVRLRGLLAQLQSDDRLVGFAESELGPLLTREAAVGDGMVDLLRHYIRLRGNKAALAQEVHISRQALYGRLRKLESILMVDLDDPESMLSLGVALLVDEIRRVKTP